MSVACCQPQGPVQLFMLHNIKNKFKGNWGHFIRFILKPLTKLKLIHTELMSFFFKKCNLFTSSWRSFQCSLQIRSFTKSLFHSSAENGSWSVWLRCQTACTEEVHSPGGKTHFTISCMFTGTSDMHGWLRTVCSLTGSLQSARIRGHRLLASYLPRQYHHWQRMHEREHGYLH